MAKKRITGEDGKEYIVTEKKPFYKKWWFILFFALPFGMTLVLSATNIFIDNPESGGVEVEEAEFTSVENELIRNIDVPEEEQLVIEDVLLDVGITNVDSVEYDEILKGTFTYTDESGWGTEEGYRLNADNANNIRLYIQDDKLLGIEYGDGHVLFRDGEVKDSILNYIVTNSEFVTYTSQAENLIKDRLKSPSTADFPSRTWSDEWSVYKRDGHIYIESYVDAQNAFGATVRDYFQVVGNIEENKIVKITIGDTVYE